MFKPSTKHVPFWKKFLGIPVEPPDPNQEVFGTTTEDGYTILDTGKLLASEKFKQDKKRLEQFAQEHNIGQDKSA